MASEDCPVTQCPLCQTPVGSRDELQVHYLSSCLVYTGESSECSVQFRWQSPVDIPECFVTLLASFSVELYLDPEGGHYASRFVNIPRGSYKGHLAVRDSFVHFIKEFTVAQDGDIIVLRFDSGLLGTSKSSVVPVRTSHAYRAVGTSRTAGDSDHTHTFTSQGKLETTHEKAVIHETTQGKERKGRRRRSEESRDRVVGQRQVEELIKQLEEVTLERDALRDNSKKASTLETKTNRLEQKVLNQLEEQLNCSICLDTYTDPKLLQCFHVYCQHCLVRLVVRDREGHLGIACPNCRQVTPVADRGVAGLKPAFHINRFLEIKELLEKPEKPCSHRLREGNACSANLGKASHCFVHKGKELELFCETCGELICLKCAIKGGKHHDHDYEELDQAFMKYKEEITPWLEPMEKQVATIKQALAQIDTCSGEISDQLAATADNIHVTFGKLREVLNIRETELIGQLDQMTQGKLKNLAAQKDHIETTLAQLSSCLHFMRETLRTGNEGNVLMMKDNTVRQVKELATPFQRDILELSTKADMMFSASADFTALCQNYGQVTGSKRVKVMTAWGTVQMDIQRPSTQLNPRQKPQVVVKRDTGYETGTLAFVGRIGGEELAGVIFDSYIEVDIFSSEEYDGVYRDGKRYFQCSPGYGLFLPASEVYTVGKK